MKTLALSAIALSLFFAQPVLAEHGQCPHKCGCPYMQHLTGSLSLTTEQKHKIQLIRAQAKPALQKNRHMLREEEEKISHLTKSKTLNHAELDKLVNRKTALVAERMKLRAHVRHEIYNILTPAQQAKMNEMEQNWKKKRDAERETSQSNKS